MQYTSCITFAVVATLLACSVVHAQYDLSRAIDLCMMHEHPYEILACVRVVTSIYDCARLTPQCSICDYNNECITCLQGYQLNPSNTQCVTTVGDVRLIKNGVANRLEGQVEILYNNVWRGVCDDGWDGQDAQVVCRQLGLVGGTSHGGSVFGSGTGLIWLDDVSCRGDELRLRDCRHAGWGQHDCNHHESAGVTCQEPEGAVRLIQDGNISRFTGRVEVFHNNEWGTICDDDWCDDDAEIVCKQLGLEGGRSHQGREVEDGEGRIWLDNMQCKGDELVLAECPSSNWGIHDCDHTEDAGVTCEGTETLPPPASYPRPYMAEVECVNGAVKGVLLVEGEGPHQAMGTVCDDGFSQNSASVACKNLGFSTGTFRKFGAHRNFAFPTVLEMLTCPTDATLLSECTHSGYHNHDCSKLEDVVLTCTYTGTAPVIVDQLTGRTVSCNQ